MRATATLVARGGRSSAACWATALLVVDCAADTHRDPRLVGRIERDESAGNAILLPSSELRRLGESAIVLNRALREAVQT
ncbi:MAG: hypothetical protein ACYCUM_13015 [Solirubrobacteraceae bacterium]